MDSRSHLVAELRSELAARRRSRQCHARRIPAALGDASLANLPPEAGLYACLFGSLVFWILCGSRYTAVSVTSAISLVIGTSLSEMTGGNTARFGALATGTALLVALIAFIAWLAKAGVLVH